MKTAPAWFAVLVLLMANVNIPQATPPPLIHWATPNDDLTQLAIHGTTFKTANSPNRKFSLAAVPLVGGQR